MSSQTITVRLTRKRKRLSSNAVNFFDELPRDIWSAIAEYLEPLSIQTLFSVSKKFLPFWKTLFYGKLIYSAKIFDSLIHWNISCIEKNARFLKRILQPNNKMPKVEWSDSKRWPIAFGHLISSNQKEILPMFVNAMLSAEPNVLDTFDITIPFLNDLISMEKQTPETMIQIFRFAAKNSRNLPFLHGVVSFSFQDKKTLLRHIEYVGILLSEPLYNPNSSFLKKCLTSAVVNHFHLPIIQVALKRNLMTQKMIDLCYFGLCSFRWTVNIQAVIAEVARLFPLVSTPDLQRKGFWHACHCDTSVKFPLLKWFIQVGKIDPFLDLQQDIFAFFDNLEEDIEKMSKEGLELFLSDSRFDPSANDNQLFYMACSKSMCEMVKMLLKIPQVYTTVDIERALNNMTPQQIRDEDRAYRIHIILKSHLIVKTFLNYFVKADGLKVMHQWCKYWRLENGETNPSEITAKLLHVLCFEPFDFKIGDDYLQFFDKLETLRVFNTCLSSTTLMYVKNFKRHNDEIGFFKARSQVVFQATSYNNFQYNELFEMFLNRKFMLLHFFISIFQFDTSSTTTKEITEVRRAIGGHLWLSIHLFLSRLSQDLPISSFSSVSLLRTLETMLGPNGNFEDLCGFLLRSYASK